jgi:hypothetical protein
MAKVFGTREDVMTLGKLWSVTLDCADAKELRIWTPPRSRTWKGATTAATQPEPDRWRVLLDPAGRPFRVTTG